MTLLRAAAGAPAPGFLPARFPLERANANRLGESYDKASPFPETKSRLRAACCKTSGRPATSPRQDRRSSRCQPIPDSRGRFARPTAAGWRFPQNEQRAAPPNGHRRRRTPRSLDRKSTRLNSSHANISYAVFCLKKKKKKTPVGARRDDPNHQLRRTLRGRVTAGRRQSLAHRRIHTDVT